MPSANAEKLYTPALLSLATELARYPIAGEWPRLAEVRARICGSTLRLGAEITPGDQFGRLGLAVSACAVGQAAAAIFARSAQGKSCDDILQALNEVEMWLARDDAPLPKWPDISQLDAARIHRSRHDAILLPWKAAKQVLCKG